MTEPRTEAGRWLALWLADADIRWPDDSTRIGGTVLTDAILATLAIEAEAAAGPRDITSLGLDVTMSVDEAFLLGYRNGEADEHSRWTHGGPGHHHNAVKASE